MVMCALLVLRFFDFSIITRIFRNVCASVLLCLTIGSFDGAAVYKRNINVTFI